MEYITFLGPSHQRIIDNCLWLLMGAAILALVVGVVVWFFRVILIKE